MSSVHQCGGSRPWTAGPASGLLPGYLGKPPLGGGFSVLSNVMISVFVRAALIA